MTLLKSKRIRNILQNLRRLRSYLVEFIDTDANQKQLSKHIDEVDDLIQAVKEKYESGH